MKSASDSCQKQYLRGIVPAMETTKHCVRKKPALVGLYACAALLAALISQYGFGLRPCELCLVQRWPYAIIAVICALTLVLPALRRRIRIVLFLCAMLYVADAGVAVYHTGVERGIFEGLESCSAGELPLNASLDDIRRQLMEAPVVSCKDTMFEFLGLSMAAWNIAYALGGAVLTVLLLNHARRTKTEN